MSSPHDVLALAQRLADWHANTRTNGASALAVALLDPAGRSPLMDPEFVVALVAYHEEIGTVWPTPHIVPSETALPERPVHHRLSVVPPHRDRRVDL